MENFIVSARKYRPATFDTVVGQNSITSTLKNAIKNNTLAQAFLFCGPRGIGKTTCARILAKTINCQNLSGKIEACDQCESCKSFNNAASFNIHELDAASNNSVEDIRQLVEQVRIPPQVGKYKVYIIDEVHMLSSSAFNAFLKTLEEPPSYAKFILATTEKHKIIPTILSRCQIFDFKRIGIEDIASHLQFVANNEHIEAEPDALNIIAQKADGALRDALSIFDQIVSFTGKSISYKDVIENLNILDYDYYFKVIDAALASDISQSLLILNEIIDNGFDGQHFIIGIAGHLRNLLVSKDNDTLSLLEVGDSIKNRYAEQANKSEILFLIKALEIINQCDVEYKNSNNKRLRLELSLMQMCSLGNPNRQEKKSPVINPPSEKKEEPQSKPIVQKPVKTEEKKRVQKLAEPNSTYDKPANKIPGTISIKGDLKSAKDHKSHKESIKTLPDIDFSQEDLEVQWSNYLKLVSNQFPSFANALRKYNPLLKEDYTVEFKTDNKVIANDRNNITKMQAYLKEQLQNHKLSLKAVITEEDENHIAYTDEEKFDEMKKKNPSLQDLKDQLDLEIEF